MESLEADQQQYRSPEIPVAMKEGVTVSEYWEYDLKLVLVKGWDF